MARDQGPASQDRGLSTEGDESTSKVYEAPRVDDLGSLAELTRGASARSTDGFGPGSSL
jgi:hypothetical protein